MGKVTVTEVMASTEVAVVTEVMAHMAFIRDMEVTAVATDMAMDSLGGKHITHFV